MKKALAALLLVLSVIVFLGSCWVAASDAQGAIIFIVTLPAAAALLWGSAALAGKRSRIRYGAYGLLAYIGLFFFGAFVPFLNMVATATIAFVAFASQAVTGQTPYEITHAKHDVKKMLEAELARTEKREIDFANIRTGWDWDRVCIFGPYTTNAAAREVLGFEGWDLERFGRISRDDSLQLFAFVDSKERAVRYSAEIWRGLGDFSSLSGKCFGKEMVKAPGDLGSDPGEFPAPKK